MLELIELSEVVTLTVMLYYSENMHIKISVGKDTYGRVQKSSRCKLPIVFFQWSHVHSTCFSQSGVLSNTEAHLSHDVLELHWAPVKYVWQTTSVTALLLLLLSHFSRVRLCVTHRRQPTRLCRPWDSPGKNTGEGCHFLLQWRKVKSESDALSLQ